MKIMINWRVKRPWLSVISIAVLILGLAAVSLLVRQRQSLTKMAAGSNASLNLPASFSIQARGSFSVPLTINTDGTAVVGVDVALNFDKNKIQLVDIEPQLAGGSAKTFLPTDDQGSFKKTEVVDQANQNGKIEFGVVSFDWNSSSLTNGLNGTLVVANLSFVSRVSPAAPLQTQINFDFNSGSTVDSNLVDENAVDILSRVTNLTLTIEPIPSPTNVPTPTFVPTNTPLPTTVPTLLPTAAPSPTASPLPTSTPALPTLTPPSTPTPTTPLQKATLSFKIKFQGITTQRPSRSVKVTLKGGQTFNDVTVTSNSQGIYSGTINNINPGTYLVLIKGWAHLQKKFGDVTFRAGGTIVKDWSSTVLKAGDFNNKNLLNIQGLASMRAKWIVLSIPTEDLDLSDRIYDINLDGRFNLADVATVMANWVKLSVGGDE